MPFTIRILQTENCPKLGAAGWILFRVLIFSNPLLLKLNTIKKLDLPSKQKAYIHMYT